MTLKIKVKESRESDLRKGYATLTDYLNAIKKYTNEVESKLGREVSGEELDDLEKICQALGKAVALINPFEG